MPPARLIYFRQSVSVACVACASSVWRASLQSSFFADGRTASAELCLQLQMQIGPHLESMQSEMQVRLKSHVTHSQPSRISAGLPRHFAFVYEKNDATLVSPTRGEGWTEHRRSDHFESTRAAEDKSGEGGKEECCWLNGQPKRRGKSSQQMRFLTGQGFDDT